MSTTTSTTDTLDRVSMILGTAMMIAWTLAIGIGGFVLLLAIAFGMVSQSLNLAAVASGLLFLPLLLTVAWGITLAAETIREKNAVRTISMPSWQEGCFDQRVRISYIPNYL